MNIQTIEQLSVECEKARLAVGQAIDENRTSGDKSAIEAALVRWNQAKAALQAAREAAHRELLQPASA